eukprot:GFUD01025848.1.p1 GENE.GFUD01025848.1~~GFUD01025848.1.p1  ORF type:complete len:319 (-),score=106.92 GFUD01025848.1:245-1201(-)
MAGAGLVVVVTGASRGIGYSIGRELAVRMPGASLYLTTREAQNIQALEATLRRDIGVSSGNVKFRMMDLKDKRSIAKFVDVVKRKHNRLDILVNNAAVYHKPPSSVHQACETLPLYSKEVEEIIKTNYLGLRAVTESFIPCLAQNSRIINISSHLAQLAMFSTSDVASAKLVDSFSNPNLSIAMLDSLVKSYLASIKSGNWSSAGWPDCAYSVSKLAVNSYTRILQAQLTNSHPKLFVSVNAVCPGTHHSKMRQAREDTISTQDSADMISYLATMRLEGVGDCSVPQTAVPKGEVLWHDLSCTRSSARDSDQGVQSAQ